jgi:hypothetical protein
MKKRELIAFILSLALFTGFLAVSGAVLKPKRVDFGSTWDLYRNEAPDSIDVLILGSSIAYCDVIPAAMWPRPASTLMSPPGRSRPWRAPTGI